MATFTHLCILMLKIFLITHVYAKQGSNSAVKWIEAGRHVVIGLATPDLFYWDSKHEVSTHYPGGFFFDLRLSPDNLTLLLNGEAILPRARTHVPASLRASQVGVVVNSVTHQSSISVPQSTVMDLDYYIETPDTTSWTSIYNTKYNPRVHIDILRANLPSSTGYNAPLSSDVQETIWIWLEDLSEHPPGTLYANIPLKISRVEVNKRWLNHDSEGTTTYRSRKSLSGCYLWSWLCADIDEYPYYEYIYRENFDEYGKKGSMRHFLTRRWGNMVNLLGFWRAVILLAVCVSMMLSPFVYAGHRGVKGVLEMYQMRIKEVDDFLADEEIDGWLESDRYYEDFGYDEKEEAAEEEERGEKTSVERSLPPPYSEEDGGELAMKS
ncbi:hypothetical protein BKA64DRAFT_737548 [Cadophora sp. MPI-SDFR-AT-0126]|nr:hypothetical protein BKA64DRAFT_737548 [Leotiomycetes sp. MPI-SDFR-AT-0126]